MPADLIVMAMHDFDIIFGIDWLVEYRACVGCFHKTITFKIEEPKSNVIFEGVRREKGNIGLVSALDAVKLLDNGCEGYFAFITEKKPHKVLGDILVVYEFPDVFPDEFNDYLRLGKWTFLLTEYRMLLQYQKHQIEWLQ